MSQVNNPLLIRKGTENLQLDDAASGEELQSRAYGVDGWRSKSILTVTVKIQGMAQPFLISLPRLLNFSGLSAIADLEADK